MAVAVQVIGAVLAYSQSRKASRARSRAAVAERNIQIARQKREKRNQLRRARAQQAEITAQSIGQGGTVTAPSSATSGAVGGVQSQYAYNLSFLDQTSALNQQAFQANQEASVFESKAKLHSTVSSAASTIKKG